MNFCYSRLRSWEVTSLKMTWSEHGAPIVAFSRRRLPMKSCSTTCSLQRLDSNYNVFFASKPKTGENWVRHQALINGTLAFDYRNSCSCAAIELTLNASLSSAPIQVLTTLST